jgi:aryl-alcohol dehydrogenase
MGNCYPQEFIPLLIREWQNGNFPFDDLITTYPAKDIEVAAKDAISGKTIKPVLIW